MQVPQWFINLCYEGCADDIIHNRYSEYLDYREEGYSREYTLVCCMGMQDPSY